jgi:hypothetical protein
MGTILPGPGSFLPGAARSAPQAVLLRACTPVTGLAFGSPHTTSNVSRTGLQPILPTAFPFFLVFLLAFRPFAFCFLLLALLLA